MEVISDIKNSIGYINVNQALKDVFGSSIFLIEYEEIGKGESDSVHKNDFRFIFKFKRWKFVLDILDTRIKGMMNSGNVGGRLSIFSKISASIRSPFSWPLKLKKYNISFF